MFTKNWKCVVSLAVLALFLAAAPAPAADIIIVSDDFTGDGTMNGRTPDGTNLPGNNWGSVEPYWGVNSTNGAEIDNLRHNNISQMDITSTGGYTKPPELTVSMTARPQGPSRNGVGATFSPGYNVFGTTYNWGDFLGLTLDDEGNVRYYHQLFEGDYNSRQGQAIISAWNAGADGAFDPNALYTLTYTVDTVSGKITAVSLTGSTEDFSAILTATQAPFTDANTNFVGLQSDDFDGSATNADITFFELTGIPEPATMAMLAFGGLGVLLKRRRRYS